VAGAFGLAFLGGHPQSAFIGSLAVLPYAVFRLVSLRPERGAAVRRAALLAGGAALGLGVAAIMLVPLVEALSQSYDISRGADPLPGRSGLAFLFPEYWGRPDGFLVSSQPTNFTERTAYVGAVPALLAVAGLVGRRPNGTQLFFVAVAIIAGLVAFKSGPVADLARDLPGLEDVNLARSVILIAFSGSVLAAFGLDLALSRRGNLRAMLAAAGALALLPVLGWAAARAGTLDQLGDALGELPRPGSDPASGEVLAYASVLRWLLVALAGLGLLALLLLRPARSRLTVPAIVALAAADLLVLAAGFHPSVEERRGAPPPPGSVRFLQRAPGEGRVAGDLEALGPNSASRYGLADARGHELPVVERQRRLWGALGGGGGLQRTIVDAAAPGTGRLLDVYGVRWVLSSRLGGPGYREAYTGHGGRVVENVSPLPRAWVAHGWRPTGSMTGALSLMTRSAASEVLARPVVEGARPPAPGSPRRPSPARVVEESDTSVTVRTRAGAAGYLILLDTHYPGWKAEVDGEEEEIRPANAAFRAVSVPAGQHEVRFRYRPASAYAGAAITGVSLLLVVALLIVSRRRRRYGARPWASRAAR
jgi:Bacterial membrane protein YfhO